MNVREIVEDYLTRNGYDGMCGDGCGCGLDDLMLCEDYCEDCQPGYKWTCAGCQRFEECEFSDYGDGCFMLEKQEKNETRGD